MICGQPQQSQWMRMGCCSVQGLRWTLTDMARAQTLLMIACVEVLHEVLGFF